MAATDKAEEILTDAVLEGITEALSQFADLVDKMAEYAEQKSSEKTLSPGQELYWGGYVQGLRDTAVFARETRPLRGIK